MDETINHNLEITYRILSACLYQPSSAWLEEDIFTHLKTALQVVAPSVALEVDMMDEAFRGVGQNELAVIHARLFIGPFSLQAPPYGSFYLEPEKKVMGATTLAVQEFYGEAGLVLEKDFAELPDHMAVELEFLSFLLQRTLLDGTEASEQWIGKRREFIRQFVSGWYSHFCAAIRQATDDPFYTAYANCLEAVISRDMENLGLQ